MRVDMPKMSISMNAATATQPRVALNGPAMGTRWSAIAYPPNGIEPAALQAALAAACDLVDTQMSTWKPRSDLMRLNAAPVGHWHAIPDALANVLALGEGVRQQSAGRFDMAVLDATNAWGFGPSGETGDQTRIGNPRFKSHLELDMRGLRARRLAPVSFDLSGIAKGFAVDLMARCMEDHGVANYLVSIDGELQAGGYRGDGQPWSIALEAPVADKREIVSRILLHNGSLATSGNYRHRRLVAGRWLSHTMDPGKGQPVENGLLSVTVRAPDCVLADAWATALMVAGETDAPRLCAANGLDAILITASADGFATQGLGAFAPASRESASI